MEKLYNSTNLETHNVDGLPIPVNPKWKKVVINLSGGADSAILAFLVCKIIEENNYDCQVDVLSYIRMWKTRPWQYSIAENVYNWLKNRFPEIIGERHTMYMPPELELSAAGPINGRAGDVVIGVSYSRYLQFQNKYDAIYNATTKNPTGLEHSRRVLARDTPKYEIDTLASADENGWFLTPFRLTEKDWIIKQYANNNVLDLLNTTRSCEQEWDDLTYENYVEGQFVPECGECFWCEERNWGKQKAGIK
jgi:hypothetical protein